MQAVYDAGMRHVDHFWNAMSSTDSIRRRVGTPQRGSMAEFVLYHPDMSTEVIADSDPSRCGNAAIRLSHEGVRDCVW